MATKTSFASLFFLLTPYFFTLAQSGDFGFTAELIHQDSPNSPLYNPSESPSQRIANAFTHSINKAKRFFPNASISTQDAQSDVISDGGGYLMKIKLGTPPVDIVGVADTGSDLIWTQCKPCDNCFEQKAPIFDPSSSSTYKNIPCNSRACGASHHTSCSNNVCQYRDSYGDKSHTIGNLALETVALPSTSSNPVAFPKTIFGCGHDNAGTFSRGSSGIIGLGGGQISLISQVGPAAEGKFSYCFAPFASKASSKIHFGAHAVVSGEGAVSTPIITKSNSKTFYYLTLEGLSVGNERVEFIQDKSSAVDGNVVIDSGTTLTLLPSNTYSQLESALRKAISAKPVRDPRGQFSLCYQQEGLDSIQSPIITAHFTNADIELKPINTFVRISEELVCLAFIPMNIETGGRFQGIFGNIAQTNFLVGYDLQKKTVTFKPTNCAGGN